VGKANVTKEKWLEAGLRRFGDSGLEGLKVERMAQELKSSKAGFYWYFKSRDIFIKDLIEYWYKQETAVAIQKASISNDPIKKLETLFLVAAEVQIYPDVLFQVRKLAYKNKKYKSILDKVENDRVGFVTGIFKELGISDSKAKQMGEFLYLYYLGWYERIKHKKITQTEMRRQFKFIQSLFSLS